MEKLLSSEEYMEVQSIVENATTHYKTKFKYGEIKDDWYAGVTGQEKDSDFELKRIKEHFQDDYPNLDDGSIGKWKVSSIPVSIQIEKILEDAGFDTGKKHNPPTDENDIYVYIFRKNKGD